MERTHASSPVTKVSKDLVLVGGGHAHLLVLRSLAMRPEPGVRVTLLSRDVHTPYSGMLPGFLAGHYGFDECHVDLRPLASWAGARFFHGEAIAIDRAAKRVVCRERPPIPYDVLSLDIGSRPKQSDVSGAREHTLPVKPIDRLAERWDALLARVRGSGGLPVRLAVVGGGAAGVELALAAQVRLRQALAGTGRDPAALSVMLVTADALLPTHAPRVARIFARVLAERGVALHTRDAVVRVEPGTLHLASGATIAFDEALWATQAGAAPWLASSGLECSKDGFVRVEETLQSRTDPSIFAAGDVADMVGHPRPKAGVFAVRQGKPLAENLRRALASRPLVRYRPQERFLSLVTTGNRYAVASKGPFVLEGEWVWRWKDRIDRAFMAKFRDLPSPMAGAESGAAGDDMRCRGCGAKVGSPVLSRVLKRLESERGDTGRADVLVGLDAPDDAAVVRAPPGKVLVQTVDFFPAFVDDPWLFGRITATHALADIFAMGAAPRTALAIASVPDGPEEKVEDALYQMMAGTLSVLRAEGVALVGGHSGEGAELALGLSVEGAADEASLLRKRGLAPGNVLVLTKPLGTGVLLAAEMRRRARGAWIDAALSSMQRSARTPASILAAHGATACTDVSGFGLAGHLLEMLRAGDAAAELDLGAVPLLDGAKELAAAGIRSTLHAQNARAAGAIRDPEAFEGDPRYALLFDPQTAGGLLAGVPAERAVACVDALRAAGERAAIVGRVTASGGPGADALVLRP